MPRPRRWTTERLVELAEQCATLAEAAERCGYGRQYLADRLLDAGHDALVARLRAQPAGERTPRPEKLTPKQEHRLEVAREARTLIGAATDLRMTEAALERALYRMGEHALVSRLKGMDRPPVDGASVTAIEASSAETKVTYSRNHVSGGREKRDLTPNEVKAWQAMRDRARRQVRPQFVHLASGGLAEGRTASDDELRELARAERETAYRQVSRR